MADEEHTERTDVAAGVADVHPPSETQLVLEGANEASSSDITGVEESGQISSAAAAAAAAAVLQDVIHDDIVVDEKAADSGAVEAAVEDYISEAAAAAISAVSGENTAEAEASAEAVAAAAAAAAAVINADGTVAALTAAVKQEQSPTAETQDISHIDPLSRKRFRPDVKLDSEVDDVDLSEVPPRMQTHEAQLAARRLKDRQRYANMTPEQRQVYNAKRREQYHRQSEASRIKRRERERQRYHSLSNEAAKERNARRARLERERYQRLTPEELDSKNRRRRDRAAAARQKKESVASPTIVMAAAGPSEPLALPPAAALEASPEPKQESIQSQPVVEQIESSVNEVAPIETPSENPPAVAPAGEDLVSV